MSIEFELIETDEALASLCEYLVTQPRIGVDLEGEWNLHRYGLHLCLIQIFDGHKTWIVDPFRATNLKPFLDFMENPAVLKISHGPQSDVILLNHKYGAEPKNIFDTEKAAQLLAYPSTSYSGLLEAKFSVIKNSKIREMDWQNRPLKKEMLEYAALDVIYLLELHTMLVAELEAKGRLAWEEEENETLDHLRFKKKENPWLEIKGANKLTLEQSITLKWLYEVRDQMASENDKPAYHIIANDKLVELASAPPMTLELWEQLKGVNPRVKAQAFRYMEGLEMAAREWKQMKEMGMDGSRYPLRTKASKARARWSERVTEVLEKVKEKIAGTIDIAPMIISSRTIRRIAWGEITWHELKGWQREIITTTANEMGLDIGFVSEGAPE